MEQLRTIEAGHAGATVEALLLRNTTGVPTICLVAESQNLDNIKSVLDLLETIQPAEQMKAMLELEDAGGLTFAERVIVGHPEAELQRRLEALCDSAKASRPDMAYVEKMNLRKRQQDAIDACVNDGYATKGVQYGDQRSLRRAENLTEENRIKMEERLKAVGLEIFPGGDERYFRMYLTPRPQRESSHR
jgi:hypothetical protein